ncbi:hypothetical protein S40285_04563 [Stachybotrys chlorohalonatus IBT 40285]|uniref:Uncharacterized protein n=1 Tax=Stachybotrys chlorohalonatus (strain IBT 40285) TaxID=1283841 RepID=A0A084QKT2_STAC4|nr:hypothetical protein S40285_04563 [Stachybotrys chlorohalonata IBT 40285]
MAKSTQPTSPASEQSSGSASSSASNTPSDANGRRMPRFYRTPAGPDPDKAFQALGDHPYGSLRIRDLADTPDSTTDHRHAPAQGGLPSNGPATARDASAHQLGLLQNSPPRPSSSRGASPVSYQSQRHSTSSGNVILFLDLPQVVDVGIDNASFTKRQFRGVRHIPPGPHFLWLTHPGGATLRSGVWIDSSDNNSVYVLQWDSHNEVLHYSGIAESRFQAESLAEFQDQLESYQELASLSTGNPPTTHKALDPDLWQRMTECVAYSVLEGIMGRHSAGWLVDTADRVRGSRLLPAEAELEKATMNPLLLGRELKFSFSQSSRTYSITQTGRDRTLKATDSTQYIMDRLSNGGMPHVMIGEFQFAFIVGWHLCNDACIQQWWYMLLKLVLRAYSLPDCHPDLAAHFLQTLAAQISYSQKTLEFSVFDYDDSHSEELRRSLSLYKSRLDEFLLEKGRDASPAQVAVGTALAAVELAVAKHGVDIRGYMVRRGNVMMEDGEQVELEMTERQDEDESGEWAPTVVDMDEKGRQRDLVSWTD